MSVDSVPEPSDGSLPRAASDSTGEPEGSVIEVVARIVVHGRNSEAVGASVARELQALADAPARPNVNVHFDPAFVDQRAVPAVRHRKELPGPAMGARLRVLVEPRLVLLDGMYLDLTRLEFDLLLFLCRNPDFVHDRSALLSSVWGIDNELNTRTVDVHIRRVRKKLGPDLDLITTVRGVGYRLNGTDKVQVESDRRVR